MKRRLYWGLYGVLLVLLAHSRPLLASDIPGTKKTCVASANQLLKVPDFKLLRNLEPNPKIRYLTDQERADSEIFFENGLVWYRDGNAKKLYDTSDGTHNGYASGVALFVMDSNGRVFAWKHSQNGVVQHPSILGMQALVASAGELRVVQGRIVHLESRSGHYMPPDAVFDQIFVPLAAGQIHRKDLRVVYFVREIEVIGNFGE